MEHHKWAEDWRVAGTASDGRCGQQSHDTPTAAGQHHEAPQGHTSPSGSADAQPSLQKHQELRWSGLSPPSVCFPRPAPTLRHTGTFRAQDGAPVCMSLGLCLYLPSSDLQTNPE